MRIHFSGYWDLSKGEVPDDQGTVEVWTVRKLEKVLADSKEVDDVFENLHLTVQLKDN